MKDIPEHLEPVVPKKPSVHEVPDKEDTKGDPSLDELKVPPQETPETEEKIKTGKCDISA